MNAQAMEFVWFISIGAVAGWLAGHIMKGAGFGLIGNIVVGVLGAVLGGWLFEQLGLAPERQSVAALLTAVVGAVLLLFFLEMLRRMIRRR
jgi:uncharacterized membrane protein YeaQ/YmgE (transglycosylase-associated protein family)